MVCCVCSVSACANVHECVTLACVKKMGSVIRPAEYSFTVLICHGVLPLDRSSARN